LPETFTFTAKPKDWPFDSITPDAVAFANPCGWIIDDPEIEPIPIVAAKHPEVTGPNALTMQEMKEGNHGSIWRCP
jgi:hypothetical protein